MAAAPRIPTERRARPSDDTAGASYPRAGRWARICAGVAVALAALALLSGWLFPGIPLARFRGDFAAMVSPTAVSVILLGAALAGLGAGHRWLVRAAAGAALLIALLRLGAQILGLGVTDAHSDRVSVGTALGLALLGLALLVATAHRGGALRRPGLPATLALVLAFFGLTGYLFDAKGLFDFVLLSGMSLPTALSLFLLALAVLLQDMPHNWTRYVLNGGAGGRLARRLLLPAVIGIFAVTAAALFGTNHGVFSVNLSHALLADLLIVLAVIALVLIARNRSQEEARLQLEKVWLRDIIDATEVAAFVFDAEGRLVLANRLAEVLAQGAADPGAWIREGRFFIPGSFEPLAGSRHPRALVAGRGEKALLYAGVISATGRELSLRMSCRRLRAAVGGDRYTILSVVDETESWKARDSISRIERLEALGLMASGAAHEFSNIIGVIQLTSDVGLMQTEGDDGPRHSQFEAISRACERGTDITTRLLDLSRESLGAPAVHDLVEVIRDAPKLLRPVIPEDLELEVSLPAPGVHVYLDRSDFEAALLNLTVNAVYAIAARPGAPKTIGIALDAGEDTVRVTVTDAGCGMDRETLAHAATPLFTTRPADGGTGLGLSMVDSFVRRSGGSMVLHSVPDEGTEVELLLPRVDATAAEAGGETYPEDDLRGLKMLVVEDDPQFRYTLPEALGLLGVEVTICLQADEALDRLARQSFDVMVSDIRIPGPMDGIDLARTVARLYPALPVLLITGFGSTRRETSDFVVLRKPVRLRVLANAIHTVVAAQNSSSGAAGE